MRPLLSIEVAPYAGAGRLLASEMAETPLAPPETGEAKNTYFYGYVEKAITCIIVRVVRAY